MVQQIQRLIKRGHNPILSHLIEALQPADVNIRHLEMAH
jgi:hypothetical protein